MIKDPEARIMRTQTWKDYHLLSLESPLIASQIQPGQFVMVRIGPHSHPLLRRPFSIHFVKGEIIEIFFQNTGLGTSLLSEKKENETLDILGPLGNGFRLEDNLKGVETAVVGGGRGIAPLFYLTHRLSALGAFVKTFYGGRTQADLPLRERFKSSGHELLCSTDDGSFGYTGLITDFFLDQLKISIPDRIYACGPEPMLRKIGQIAQKNHILADLSLESVMGCGFGACWGCVKMIKKEGKKEWRKICEDGPVFSPDEIIWLSEEE